MTADLGAYRGEARHDYSEAAKRLFDLVGALFALTVMSPLLVVIGVVLILSDGRPILYRHQRIGRGGQDFGCLKFRTMAHNSAALLEAHLAADPGARREWMATRKLKQDPRVTRVGAILRKWSLDETPQLINVLRGDMSLVGPRPIVRDEAGYYGDRIAIYESVRPGLTGPWQVGGRSDLSFDGRVALDCQYAAGKGLLRDLAILLRTFPAILARKGSY